MILALIGALCIGISLGLLGSGGSILTVPVLVYVLKHPEKQAMAESLAIVGSIALFGSAQYAIKKLIDWRSVIYFGLPGMAGAYLGAWGAKFVPAIVLMVIFAMFMLLAAYMMLRPPRANDNTPPTTQRSIFHIAIEGFIVGGITGMIGAGGGFLIIPALVILGGLSMHTAIGTSLCIIAMKSASGLVKYIDVVQHEDLRIDWPTVGLFILVGCCGTIAGNIIRGRINQTALKRAFAVFLILMGSYICINEMLKIAA